jgi:hypothetical protein
MVNYKINGETVTRDEFLSGDNRIAELNEGAPGVPSDSAWPMESNAAGVAVSQISEAVDHAKSVGCPTEYSPRGNPIFTSRRHRKEFCEKHGLFDRNGGYGDPQRKTSR